MTPREPAFPFRCEMDVCEELCEVERARRLADAVVRPLVDAHGNRAPSRERSRDVAPYISESTRPSPRMSALTRWLPPLVEPPKRTSSWLAATLSESMIARRRRPSTYEPRAGLPPSVRSASTAIASFSVDPAGKRARAFQAVPSPVVRSRTYTALDPGKARTSGTIRCASRPSRCGTVPRGRAARGSPKTCGTRARLRRPASVVAVTETVTSRRGSGTRRSNLRPRRWRVATTLPPARTTSSFVPRGAVPATRPNETSYGAGARRAGGGRGGGGGAPIRAATPRSARRRRTARQGRAARRRP